MTSRTFTLSRSAVLASVALAVPLIASGQAGSGGAMRPAARRAIPGGPRVSVTMTTDDRTRRLQKVAGTAFTPMRPGAKTVVVDDERDYQTVVGFGAAWTDSAAYLLREVAKPAARARVLSDLFTREGHGIGLSFMRIPMGASDIARTRYSYDDRPAGRTDPTLAHFSIAHDERDLMPLIRDSLALNPRMRLMANPWSPPGWMKSSGSMLGGTLLPQWYGAFAHYFVRFLEAYRRAGIPIAYISLQNEPLYQPKDYPGMSMPAATELAVLRDDVLPALRAAHLPTRVLLYDHNWDRPDYPDTILTDPTIAASAQVAGVAWHYYAGTPGAQSVLHNKYPRAGQFETEASGGTWVGDPVRSDFETIIEVLRNEGRSYLKWSLALDEHRGPHDGGCGTCTPIVTVDRATGALTEDIEYATLGQFSRFILPGATRVYSSEAPGIESVAFVNPHGGHVLVAFNDTARADSFQVEWGGEGFLYTLPAFSGATFTWGGTASGRAALRAGAVIPAASDAVTGGRDTSTDLSTWALRTEESSSPSGGYDLGYAADGDWAMYPAVDFGSGVRAVSAEVACASPDCGTLEFHLDSRSGPLIARLAVRPTGAWQGWKRQSVPAGAAGIHDLYVLWKADRAGDDALASLLSFRFQ